MIFTARQIVEKCKEYDNLFILFADLKPYNSVPKSARWSVLERCGVPPQMLGIIRSFHDCMVAPWWLPHSLTSTLSAEVAYWRQRCSQAGMTVKYKHGRKLVGDRTAKSHLSEVC